MENGCLPAYARIVHSGVRVDVGAAIEEQLCGVNIAELCGQVQHRSHLSAFGSNASQGAKMIGKSPFHSAFTSAPQDTRSSIIGMRLPLSAARINGPSPPWCTSEPFSIIHFAIANRGGLGGSHGTRHSATHVSGPFFP
jgi:hypothetical protein